MKRELGKGQRIELKRCAKVSVDGKEGCPVRITQYIIQHVAHPSVHCQAMHNADATSPIPPIIGSRCDSIVQKQLRARALTVHIWLACLVGADENTPPTGSYALAECETWA